MVRIREGERALEAERKKNKALRAETSGASKLSERVSELENEVKERDARIADILAEGEALSKKMGQVRKKKYGFVCAAPCILYFVHLSYFLYWFVLCTVLNQVKRIVLFHARLIVLLSTAGRCCNELSSYYSRLIDLLSTAGGCCNETAFLFTPSSLSCFPLQVDAAMKLTREKLRAAEEDRQDHKEEMEECEYRCAWRPQGRDGRMRE